MRLRTPANDRELLAVPDFAAVPALVERNREILQTSSVVIDGISLPELRRLARRELLGSDHREPLIVTGHQPELFHSGVWVKNFAAAGLAKRIGGTAVNLIVDSDAAKSNALALPVWERWEPASVKRKSLAFAGAPGDQSWETYSANDEAEFRSIPARIAESAREWGFVPQAACAWKFMGTGKLAERFTEARTGMEREWGCSNLELRTSVLSRSVAFQHFANQLVNDRDRVREVHNAAVRAYRVQNGLRSRTHPVPELTEGEVPFWHVGERGREKATIPFDPVRIRPRALTLTLFARLCFGDLFLHGIGGGKYDAVTDAIIRSYFGIEPPAFQVVSATLHLPLPNFPGTSDDAKNLHRLVRDLHWNPHRHRPGDSREHDAIRESKDLSRRGQYRAFRALGDRLRPSVADEIERTREEVARVKSEVAANAILKSREYSWVLYPEELLRPFLQGVQRRARVD